MTESQRMLQILHENKLKVREENKRKKKESKLETIMNYSVLFVAATIFMLGIMTLLSMIENISF